MLAKNWYCPDCPAAASTFDDKLPHHRCRGTAHGMMIPLREVGVSSKLQLVERGDVVGSELVQLSAEGRPVMAAVTTYDDREDCTVYAPTARGERD
jgi:hypothetical protein